MHVVFEIVIGEQEYRGTTISGKTEIEKPPVSRQHLIIEQQLWMVSCKKSDLSIFRFVS